MTRTRRRRPAPCRSRRVAVSFVLALSTTLLTMPAFATDCDSSKAVSNVSFAETIEPLLHTSCAHDSCHTNDAPAVELILASGYSYWFLVNVRSTEVDAMKRVEPGDPEASYLVHKLRGTHIEAGGNGERMPFGVEPLTEQEMATIVTWILDCSPKN